MTAGPVGPHGVDLLVLSSVMKAAVFIFIFLLFGVLLSELSRMRLTGSMMHYKPSCWNGLDQVLLVVRDTQVPASSRMNVICRESVRILNASLLLTWWTF